MHMWVSDAWESAGVVAASSATLAATQMATGAPLSAYTSLIVPAVSAVVGAAMGYAVLQSSQKRMAEDIKDLRREVRELVALLHTTDREQVRMEGRVTALERRGDST